MKKYTFIYAALMCLCFTSCEKWLEVNPTDQYSSLTFWTTDVNANAGLMGCYNALYPWRMLHSYETDMLTSNCVSYNEVHGTRTMARGQALSTIELANSLWQNCYKGIGRCNSLLDNIDGISTIKDADKAAMKGEAKFLRAFFYSNMVDKFGGVPLITSAPNAAEQESLPRNTKDECLAQIYQDLKDAIAVLPDKYNAANTGRATKGAARTLLARMYLYNGKYAEAAAVAKDVIDSGSYKLFDDYRHFWSEANKNHCEVIFDIQAVTPEYTFDYDAQIYQLNRPAPLKELVDSYLCTDGLTIDESPLYDPANPYDNRDPRLLMSVACIGKPFNGVDITPSKYVLTGFGSKKYTSFEDEVAIAVPQRSAHNFILMRYAEVLLTYAEAMNETSGPDQSVYDALNALRTRPDINMPKVKEGLSKEEMREVIRRERRSEFAMEGLYYSDVLRWKTIEVENNGFVHMYDGTKLEERKFDPNRDYLWPIPYNQILQNPNLEQNPNW